MTFQKMQDGWIEIWDSEDNCHTFNLDDLALIKRIGQNLQAFRMEVLVHGWSLYLDYGKGDKAEQQRETDYHDLINAKFERDTQKHAVAMKLPSPEIDG